MLESLPYISEQFLLWEQEGGGKGGTVLTNEWSIPSQKHPPPKKKKKKNPKKPKNSFIFATMLEYHLKLERKVRKLYEQET